jgi:hypothetical protein
MPTIIGVLSFDPSELHRSPERLGSQVAEFAGHGQERERCAVMVPFRRSERIFDAFAANIDLRRPNKLAIHARDHRGFPERDRREFGRGLSSRSLQVVDGEAYRTGLRSRLTPTRQAIST